MIYNTRIEYDNIDAMSMAIQLEIDDIIMSDLLGKDHKVHNYHEYDKLVHHILHKIPFKILEVDIDPSYKFADVKYDNHIKGNYEENKELIECAIIINEI